MTTAAPFHIQLGTMPDLIAIANARGSVRLELVNIAGNVHDGLRINQMVLVRKMLHPDVPTAIVTVIHQLFGNNGDVLSGNAGNTAIETSLAR